MNCSIKNYSLRNLLNDKYLLKLWTDYQESYKRKYYIKWNTFNQQHFFIEFRKTVSLEQLRLFKLEDLILKLNLFFWKWDKEAKIEILTHPDTPVTAHRILFE